MKKIAKHIPRVKQCADCGVRSLNVFRSIKYNKDYCKDCLTLQFIQDISPKETE
jgi:hypothetical protein